MATLQALRKRAVAAGVPVSKARKASAEELRGLIAKANGKPTKAVARKSVQKSVKVSKSRPTKAPARKTRTASTAKRPSTTAAKRSTSTKSGRNLIEGVDFNSTKNWNPRVGSCPDRIIKSLKKFKGNRDKVFEDLKADVWDFVGKTMRNGDKRSKPDAYKVLKYRIHRTLFDFVVKTGQHKISTNRIQYGTGPNASKATQRKLSKGRAKAAPAKRGRPAKKRGPGRPKGSKNKTR